MTARLYGTLGLAGVGLMALALLALPFLDPQLSLVDEYISVYGRGEYGWLLDAGLVAGGLGTIAIGLGLKRTLNPGKRATASWILIVLAGLGFVAGGFFVTDPTGAYEAGTTTVSGTIHNLAAFIAFFSLVLATWLLRGTFASGEPYHQLAGAALWVAVILSAGLVLLFFVAGPLGFVGVVQRIFVGV